MYLHTGTVQSNTILAPASAARPTSDEYAANIVKALGSGRMEVVPYVGHQIGLTVIRNLPGFILPRVLREDAEGLLRIGAKKQKKE